MKVLVTGAAGFIGMHVCQHLLRRGDDVLGVDNLNDYYSVELKQARLARLKPAANFRFEALDVADEPALMRVLGDVRPERIIHLAAQAGVRYSVTHPHVYGSANLVGFLNMLEASRQFKVEHLVYASSSSVYGANTRVPWSVHDSVDHPISLYAATKKANELMAHSYAHLYRIPCTGLRFFTVYGPWGRPDMAAFSFARDILAGKSISVFNHGRMRRDFTYIDDIVEGVVRILDRPAAPDTNWTSDAPDAGSSAAPYRVYNIGNNQPVELLYLIEVLEQALGVTAKKEFLPMQPGDVVETYADVTDLARDVGFAPKTPIEIGIGRFVEWYREYFKV